MTGPFIFLSQGESEVAVHTGVETIDLPSSWSDREAIYVPAGWANQVLKLTIDGIKKIAVAPNGQINGVRWNVELVRYQQLLNLLANR